MHCAFECIAVIRPMCVCDRVVMSNTCCDWWRTFKHDLFFLLGSLGAVSCTCLESNCFELLMSKGTNFDFVNYVDPTPQPHFLGGGEGLARQIGGGGWGAGKQ